MKWNIIRIKACVVLAVFVAFYLSIDVTYVCEPHRNNTVVRQNDVALWWDMYSKCLDRQLYTGWLKTLVYTGFCSLIVALFPLGMFIKNKELDHML